MTDERIFKVPKKNIKKLGKVFDLDNINGNTYKVKLLSDVTGLTVNSLDKFSAISHKQVNPDYYIAPTVSLEVSELVDGYQISVAGSSITVDITQKIPNIAGILIVNDTTDDILCADIESAPIGNVDNYLTIIFSGALWKIGETVCTG